mgnify:CR=1 FL=1
MLSPTEAVSKKLKNYIDLTDQELDTLARMPGRSLVISAGEDIVHEGQSGHRAFILQDGWVMSYVHDANRNAAEVLILHAQDFLGDPVARIELPARVPFGFHGNWCPDA